MKQSIGKTIHPQSGLQRGLSLIELMISITIGLLILVTLSTLFINQSKTRAELEKSNRMIDNGRYAIELLSDNLRLAGFYDSYVPTSGIPAALYDPCDKTALTNSTENLDIMRVAVQGYNASTTSTPVFSALCAAVPNVALNPGSDILVVRRASTVSLPQPSTAVSGTIYLQVSSCPSDAINYVIATAPAAFPLYLKTCATTATLAPLRPFLVQAYFVSPYDIAGDGIPTLKRVEFDPAGSGNFVVTPLVEGIEYMQIDYGVDDTSDGEADRYVDCSLCSITDWSNVVSVKINLVARNQDPTWGYSDSKTYNLGTAGTVGPFNASPYNASPYPTTYPQLQNYKRHSYTQLIRLVNPAGRRETPCASLPCR